MTNLVGELHSRSHMTVLMVTHDAGDASRIADRVLRIVNGRIDAFDAVENAFRGGRRPGPAVE
jgi:ABC-type thiamine transport system ATPase subunit